MKLGSLRGRERFRRNERRNRVRRQIIFILGRTGAIYKGGKICAWSSYPEGMAEEKEVSHLGLRIWK